MGISGKGSGDEGLTEFAVSYTHLKITLRFRGREMAHMNNSKHILDDIAQSLSDIAVVEKDVYKRQNCMNPRSRITRNVSAS